MNSCKLGSRRHKVALTVKAPHTSGGKTCPATVGSAVMRGWPESPHGTIRLAVYSTDLLARAIQRDRIWARMPVSVCHVAASVSAVAAG